jgi:hypothetical protein
MKKILLLSLVATQLSSLAQNASQVFSTEELVYYGIDFSNCRLVGDFGNGSAAEIKVKMFPGWNNVVAKEQEKYNLRLTFKKPSVYYDLEPVRQRNEKTDESKLLTFNSDHVLKAADIQQMVSQYSGGEKSSGVGLVFIAENLNKNVEAAFVHVTFFDIATKKVYFSEKLQGHAMGAGLRNYWANSIHAILVDIQQMGRYDNWKKTYGGK